MNDGVDVLATARAPRSLIYAGYRPGIVLICLGMVLSIMLLGLRMPYYNKAASDMVSVYEALLFNSNLTQEFLVYPGVVDRTLLGLWLAGLHGLGMIPVSRLDELRTLDDMRAYDAQWQTLVQAGRVYSLLTGMACVVATIALVKRWLGVWQIAILAGIALAFSSGFALGFRILRPEMVTSSLVFIALLLLIVSAKEASHVWRLAGLAGAGFLVSVAIIDKVQSVIPAFALLPLAVALGAPGQSQPSDRDSKWALVAVTLAALAAWPATGIIREGIAGFGDANHDIYKPLSGGMSGYYQPIGAGLALAFMAGYAAIWRVSLAATIAAMAAVTFGLACGLDLLRLQTSHQVIVAVVNPIEHLQGYSAGAGSMLMSQSPGAIVSTLATAFVESLKIHTFLHPMHRPTLIIEWLTWAGLVYAWRQGRMQMALQIFMLLGCALCEDAFFSLRQVKVYYLPYSDFPLILAGALALSQFRQQLTKPVIEKATLAIMAVYIIWGHAQPALAVYSRHDKGKVCGIVVQFTKRISFPYCAGQVPPGTAFDLQAD